MGQMRPATEADLLPILSDLRDADRAEIKAFTGCPAEFICPSVFQVSDRVWTLVARNGDLVGMVGTHSVVGAPDFGCVWMFASNKITKHRMEFLRASKGALSEIHKLYPALTNYVDARNTLHINWLRWLGFTFLRRIEKYGAESLPFYEFVRLAPCAPPS